MTDSGVVKIKVGMRKNWRKVISISTRISVIIGRALPEVADGFQARTPRILYAMYKEGLLSNKNIPSAPAWSARS